MKIQKEEKEEKEGLVESHTNSTGTYNGSTSWFIRNKHLIEPRFMIKSFLVVLVIQVMFEVGASLLIWGTSAPNFINTTLFLVGIAFYVFGFIFLAFKLRKARDAFFLKDEFKGTTMTTKLIFMLLIALGIYCIVILILSFILQGIEQGTSVTDTADLITWTIPVVLVIGNYFIVTFLPLYKSYKTHESSDEHQIELISTTNLYTLEGVLSEPRTSEAFLKHLQLEFQVENLYFLFKVGQFSVSCVNTTPKLKEFKSEPSLCVGRAVLMYQKFLRSGSYLDLRVPQDILKEIEDVVSDEEKALQSGVIGPNFFDKVEKIIMERLRAPMQNFFVSETFLSIKRDVKEENKLHLGLKNVGVSVE